MGIIMLLLLLLPYILVPLILVIIFKNAKIQWKLFSYFLDLVIIFLYPFFLFWLDDLGNENIENVKCILPEYSVILFNSAIMIPITLIILRVFYSIFSRNKAIKTKSKI